MSFKERILNRDDKSDYEGLSEETDGFNDSNNEIKVLENRVRKLEKYLYYSNKRLAEETEKLNEANNEIKVLEDRIKNLENFSGQANEILTDRTDKINEASNEIKTLNKSVNKLTKASDSYSELFNIIFVESNFKTGGDLRKLQMQTFELLKFVVNVCEKYGFVYWLDYGSLLGAIRHEGFVPWDDEADISMPREDYEKFLKIIDDEIDSYPQFKGNVEHRRGVGKLRRVNFSGIPSPGSQFVQRSPLANVDVHPMDYYKTSPDNENELLKEFDKLEFKKHNKNIRNKVQSGEYDDFTKAALIEGEAVNITFEKTNFIGSPIDGALRTPILTSEIFPLKKATFEGVEFNIPNNPVKYLNTHYGGDVRKMPPVSRNHHRVDLIRKRIAFEDLDDAFADSISAVREANENFNFNKD